MGLLCLSTLTMALPQAAAKPAPPPHYPLTLTSPNPQNPGGLGCSVSISDGKVVVGAVEESSGGYDGAGNVYVFTTSGKLISTLTSPNPQYLGYFGNSVSISGCYVVVGAPYESSGGYSFAGNAYVFR